MCTVTFVPNDSGCIITHNRDENIHRKTSLLPKVYTHENIELIYPKDQEKHGTWFAADKTGRVACVLNGAFKKHKVLPPYKKSRGLIVLEAFLHSSFYNWCNTSDLENIEPFTLILFDEKLIEFRWDGAKKHIKKLNELQSHIWSSATLYTDETKRKRKEWLSNWFKATPVTGENLLDFHNNAGEGNKETNLRMSFGENHKTVSVTQYISTKNQYEMHHFNFLSEQDSIMRWS